MHAAVSLGTTVTAPALLLLLLLLLLAVCPSAGRGSPQPPLVSHIVEQPSDPLSASLGLIVSSTVMSQPASSASDAAVLADAPSASASAPSTPSALPAASATELLGPAEPRARLPSVFISHGGGPSFFMPVSSARFVDIGPDSAAFRSLQSLPQQLRLMGARRPRALLVISAHWESDDGAVHITSRSSYPGLLYDYGGFPPHTYQLKYPAPGDVQLSQRVQSLLSAQGIAARLDADRLFDHGVFVPLMVAFPSADLPVVQLSLLSSLDAAAHFRIGQALRPLRDEGVLIVGSGFITHNFQPTKAPHAFMDRMTHILTRAQPEERQRALTSWQQIDGATDAHKRADHFMPLLVAVGAAGEDQGTELAKLFVMENKWAFANYAFESVAVQ